MKRLIGIFMLVLTVATMFTACGKFTCDLCEEEKSGKKYKDEFLGEEVIICKDCYKELEELGEELADAFG